MLYPPKSPNDNLDYEVDWSDWLVNSETILTSIWIVPSGLTAGSSTNTATAATQRISGGTAGQQYTIINRITTSGSNTAERSVTINVIFSPAPTAWTYDPTAMDSTEVGIYIGSTIGQRYQIRFFIQDTNTNRQLVQDSEIDWMQTQEANVYMAAAACCDMLIAKAGAVKSKTIGDLSITYDPHFYVMLGAQLRSRGMTYQIPYAGGISIADKVAVQDDSDWVTPAISRGLDDNPGAPKPQTPSSNPLTTI